MTRAEAQQNHKAAMQALEAIRAEIKRVGFSDMELAEKLHSDMLSATEAVKVAYALRTKFAPAI